MGAKWRDVQVVGSYMIFFFTNTNDATTTTPRGRMTDMTDSGIWVLARKDQMGLCCSIFVHPFFVSQLLNCRPNRCQLFYDPWWWPGLFVIDSEFSLYNIRLCVDSFAVLGLCNGPTMTTICGLRHCAINQAVLRKDKWLGSSCRLVVGLLKTVWPLFKLFVSRACCSSSFTLQPVRPGGGGSFKHCGAPWRSGKALSLLLKRSSSHSSSSYCTFSSLLVCFFWFHIDSTNYFLGTTNTSWQPWWMTTPTSRHVTCREPWRMTCHVFTRFGCFLYRHGGPLMAILFAMFSMAATVVAIFSQFGMSNMMAISHTLVGIEDMMIYCTSACAAFYIISSCNYKNSKIGLIYATLCSGPHPQVYPEVTG